MSDLLDAMLAMKAKVEATTTPRIYGVRCHPADVAAIRHFVVLSTGDPANDVLFAGPPYLTSPHVQRGWPQVAYSAEVWRRWQEEANEA